jgi:hypothetical protein
MDLVLVNLALASFMAGVGWLVELLVYPQFAGVPPERWAAYHRAHGARITPVVGPPMLAAPLVAAVLVAQRPDGAPGALLVANLLLPAALLLATAGVFGPLHTRLGAGAAPELLRRLTALNRLRTAAWTAHLAVALALAATVT